mgnify:CR=1 FL=1
MFEGLIWFIVPVSMIVINDSMAYLFGFFFGKTPLIKLSPKKTWEGFIGGVISTVILGMIVCTNEFLIQKKTISFFYHQINNIQVSHLLCGYQFFVCPIESYDPIERVFKCTPSKLFQLTEYCLPETLQFIFKIVIISRFF